ncbi:MAG: fatty acid desaturase [Planctomycetota bacterium]
MTSHATRHEEARAALAQGLDDELRPLRHLRARPRATELLCVIGGYAVGAGLVLRGMAQADHRGGVALWIAGTFVAAVALNASVLLMHEGMHGVLFASPRLNRWVSVLCGLPVLMSFSAYRVLHLRHHRHLGSDGDPDEYRNYAGSPLVVYALQYVRLSVGCYLYLLMIPRLAWRHGDAQDRRRIAAEYALLVAVFAALFALVPGAAMLWAWFVPVAVVALFTSARGLTQHGLTDVDDPLLASRSLRPGRLVSTLLLNENLHLEHHLFPEVPSYHLPALQRLLDDRLPRRCEGRSYLAFLGRFFLQSLRLDESPVGVRSTTAEPSDAR